MLLTTLRTTAERVMPLLALVVLLTMISQVIGHSVGHWLAGSDVTQIVPVFEAPIANAGKALGALLTAWMPAWVIATPFGPLDVRATTAYVIYEWFKLPLILFLTTYAMALLRLSVSTAWLERTLGRNDLLGILGGVALGMVTPVCSCTVTNIYAGLAADGASRRASAAFLFASPALNEFAIIFMFVVAGPMAGLVYVVAGALAAILTGYLAPVLGLDPNRFVQRDSLTPACRCAGPASILARAYQEAWLLFRRLLGVVLLSGLLAGILVNFNLTLVTALQQAGSVWWGPILATVLGLPLDINAAATAPILAALHQIVPLGTLVAAMMATTVASMPEWVMLQRLLGRAAASKVVLWYAGYVMGLGLLLNWLFA